MNTELYSEMENDINKKNLANVNMVQKILISTFYNSNPSIASITQLGASRVFLLMSDKPDKTQEEALAVIKKALGQVLEIKTVKVNMYDVVGIAKECVKLIDAQPNEEEIIANITSGRKTLSLGLLYASYARTKRVKKIIYLPDEDKGSKILSLPKLSFKLTESQKILLEKISFGDYKSISELSKVVDLSTAMTYRSLDELKDMDLISLEDGIKLTDAGKIARL